MGGTGPAARGRRPGPRVTVCGISGVGKTTFARELARRLDVPHVEVDSLFHGPGWTKRDSFEADVDAATSEAGWVADSCGYESVRDLLWSRADTIVWLDYGRPLVMARVLRRSFARATYDRALWNGNREGFRDWGDPEHPVRWAWSQHGPRRASLEARTADPKWASLDVVRLRTPREARAWLDRVQPAREPGSGGADVPDCRA